ncbi:MAG: hypothetical protein A3H96_22210 [Acidobacteria bacterium RIFCSPLOWO2_02_FULL_67_36]|nr:MAG: hypothetical protein A3H96_22210 [Acidobacteria bacterium RIFCSPLOWO2_02_FULL_67_36]OFW20293.1 MAG: hypothetical protein A3G21_26900 [Acidobacteria bacterium RIFCSPLOWO2_12_FULL_66_21]
MAHPKAVSRGLVAALVLLAGAGASAVSAVKGIMPGRSVRAEAEKVFGRPVNATSDSRASYGGQDGAEGIDIEYRGGVVDRIDVRFNPALASDDVQRQLGLPAPSASRTIDGRLTDYYGGSRTLVLTHESADATSPIPMVTYLSAESFARAVEGLGPREWEPPSTAVRLSNPSDGPKILQFNPGACNDIYLWAQREQDVAKRARNVARRQAILAIVIASQRGECGSAAKLAAEYKETYKASK